MSARMNAKLQELEAWLLAHSPIALAFSGGVDSRFLGHVALRCGATLTAFHAKGPHIPQVETAEAQSWARAHGLSLCVMECNPLYLPAVAQGACDRCYHCKLALYEALREGSGDGVLLCDGSNASDLTEYRPGMQALREMGVRSPLAELGIDKPTIRKLAAMTGMDNPQQAARPCLLTRFAYGLSPDTETLIALETAEQAVEQVLVKHTPKSAAPIGFRLRVEGLGKWTLHVELTELKDALLHELEDALCSAGFDGCPVVPIPQLSGYFDKNAGLLL